MLNVNSVPIKESPSPLPLATSVLLCLYEFAFSRSKEDHTILVLSKGVSLHCWVTFYGVMYHSLSIHLGHLGYSQIFAYYETLFYEHCILCFFVNRGLFSSGINAQELDCMISICLVVSNCHYSLESGKIILHSHQQCKIQLLWIPANT